MAVERAPSRDIGIEGARSPLRLAAAVAAIRRLEFYVVELTIFSIPLLVVATAAADLTSATVLEGFAMFFALYAVGDMINCLADRDLDVVYKTRLSRAVYLLGVRAVTWLVVGSLIIGVLLAVDIAADTGRWLILALVAIGVGLGVEYSVGPIYFKGRGVGHLVCLWLLLYFLPMLCASLLLADGIGLDVVVLAATYATVEMGIILINTSEDLPEDRAAGIQTTTVALGLVNTLRLAAAMVAVGGIGFCLAWVYLNVDRGVGAPGYLAVGALAAVCALVFARIWRLARAVARQRDETTAIGLVKSQGALVPVAATLVGWVGVVCGVVILVAGID